MTWLWTGQDRSEGTHHVLVVGVVGVDVPLQLLGGGEGLATVAGVVGWRVDCSHPADWRTWT